MDTFEYIVKFISVTMSIIFLGIFLFELVNFIKKKRKKQEDTRKHITVMFITAMYIVLTFSYLMTR
ncbi:hypothetical protein [Solibacillus sp. CAU 1738]|uniref:hypothetical protein n=1 Tax=Solibacillus sp. CAU 1738 TaxID=3140363 RepID=UPI0032601966